MKNWCRVIIFFSLCSFFLGAQEIDYEFRSQVRHQGEDTEGFVLKTSLGLPFSYSHSKSRLGISDGNYIKLAGRLKSSLHFTQDIHDWSTSLFLAQAYSMNPTVKNRWIKSEDILQFETRYLYNLLDWMGFFAHARLKTSIFKSINIHDKEKDYELQNTDQSVRETTKLKEIQISTPFLPLFLTENLGVFMIPVEYEEFTWEARVAASFRQTFADNQKVVVEDKDDKIIVRDLRSFFQIGPLVGTSINGTFLEGRLGYEAGVDVMYPAWQHPKVSNRSFVDSLLLESKAGIFGKLSSYAYLEYEYTALRIPDILQQFQQQHMINLIINFDWIHKFSEEV